MNLQMTRIAEGTPKFVNSSNSWFKITHLKVKQLHFKVNKG
jgi:hypothetical protein